ncbi:MAG: hypothetical protein NT135_01045 [Candidatus Berkelbacteria bacterium]|nr:hypothetical protein [Candidatus Berkelbacteria bacterium]
MVYKYLNFESSQPSSTLLGSGLPSTEATNSTDNSDIWVTFLLLAIITFITVYLSVKGLKKFLNILFWLAVAGLIINLIYWVGTWRDFTPIRGTSTAEVSAIWGEFISAVGLNGVLIALFYFLKEKVKPKKK